MYRSDCLTVKKMYNSPLIFQPINGYCKNMVIRYPFKINTFSCSSHNIHHSFPCWANKDTRDLCDRSAKDAEA